MIRPGVWQELKIVKQTDFGVYLAEDEEERVLLPKKQVPEGAAAGDTLRVFIYKDSRDRLISTVHTPLITLGEVRVLKVKEVSGIGAFLDWGLEKDLFLPFKEQQEKVKKGFSYPVAMYLDKSDRLAATMWIDKYLKYPTLDEKRTARALLKMEADTENVYEMIRQKGGELPYDDQADPEVIRRDFDLSKNAFKKAVGCLMKAQRLQKTDGKIRIL